MCIRDRAYDKTQGAYDKIVKWLLARPGMALVSYGILTAIAVLLFMHWPSTFIPDEDDGYFIAVVQLPPAASPVSYTHLDVYKRQLHGSP